MTDPIRQRIGDWPIAEKRIAPAARLPTIPASLIMPRPEVRSAPCLQPARNLFLRNRLSACLDVRPLQLQFCNGRSITAGRVIECHEFSNHLAYAHTTGRSARLNFVGGGSIDLNGASVSHDRNLERSALFANAQLPLLARSSD